MRPVFRGRNKYLIIALAAILIAAAGFYYYRFYQRAAKPDAITQIEEFRKSQNIPKVNVAAPIYEALMLVESVNEKNQEIIAAMPVSSGHWNEYKIKINPATVFQDGLILTDIKTNDTIAVKTNDIISRAVTGDVQLLAPVSLALLKGAGAAFWGR